MPARAGKITLRPWESRGSMMSSEIPSRGLYRRGRLALHRPDRPPHDFSERCAARHHAGPSTRAFCALGCEVTFRSERAISRHSDAYTRCEWLLLRRARPCRVNRAPRFKHVAAVARVRGETCAEPAAAETRKTHRRPLRQIARNWPRWYNPRLEISRFIMLPRNHHGRRCVLPAGEATFSPRIGASAASDGAYARTRREAARALSEPTNRV